VTCQAPPQGGSIVPPDNKWFIAYGTLDKGTPERFSRRRTDLV